MSCWAETDHLSCSQEGRISLKPHPEDEDGAPRPLGHVEWADVPAGLEPELAELLDLWRDTPSIKDLHDEWRAGYHRDRGCRRPGG